MGSGSRFDFSRTEGFGIGIYVSKFPFSYTIHIMLLAWDLRIGFGKAYDDERYN